MTGQRAPRPLPLPRPPPRRPHPRPPAPGRESAAGRPDPPQGPEAGGARVQGPGEGPPAARRLQVQSIDTALSGEGAPSLSLSPGGRAALARAPAWPPTPLSAAAPPGPPHSGGGWRERPVGGQVGRRGRRGPGAEPRWREPNGHKYLGGSERVEKRPDCLWMLNLMLWRPCDNNSSGFRSRAPQAVLPRFVPAPSTHRPPPPWWSPNSEHMLVVLPQHLLYSFGHAHPKHEDLQIQLNGYGVNILASSWKLNRPESPPPHDWQPSLNEAKRANSLLPE
ncbi:proline-rich protein 2-like isoform X2 [Vulpes lagopus]|uniref:proline-rich protein 2-like isoform X2 n=1 Tax=Vulpes lagopus TaxID=494514 RepID=UPI001BC98668|nr:proline-rich protein 2-like isoform X2 [Vulpes lagopus]